MQNHPIALRHRIANALVPESPIMGPTHPVRNADSCSPGPLAFLIGRGRDGNESHRSISDLNGCCPWPTCPSTDWSLGLVERGHVRWHHDAELLQCCTSRSASPRLALSVGMRLIELCTDILGYDAPRPSVVGTDLAGRTTLFTGIASPGYTDSRSASCCCGQLIQLCSQGDSKRRVAMTELFSPHWFCVSESNVVSNTTLSAPIGPSTSAK
ncbi:uncharacterized protein BDZ83DRAFT_133079 [Colletotrichum acutatum]|uniref:Uncharacterized protein n=1 Tax=Glomerella acutata TaxID=27357 RepID=A0AAD8UBZ2_GLOAC|nr:uncharacterized protein BDZ83DRAFT_133079 [Colletotrichum acutatum]KAK1710306.1 hypothetical protein BDZ83DRAFT_133079 [Colletotrichum acutatum]